MYPHTISTHHKLLQACAPCIAHKDAGAGLKAEWLWAPMEGGRMELLAVHVEAHLLVLHGQRETRPLAVHFRHFEGRHRLCTGGPRGAVVENDALGLVLHRGEAQAQLHHSLLRVGDGEQHTALDAGGVDGDDDGKVPEERVRHKGLGQAADVGVGPKVVGREALIAGDEGDRRRERHTYQLSQIQVRLGSSL